MKGNHFRDKNKISFKPKNIILSVVSIIELIILLTTMTFAWFEGLTSLEITGNSLNTASGLKSKFIFGEPNSTDKYNTTAELSEFFYSQSFDKISPVSSYDGDNFYALAEAEDSPSNYSEYVSAATNNTAKFRKLSDEEKNSSIIHFQFEIASDSCDTDVWFKSLPTVRINGNALSSENNPFRFCFDDGTGAAPNGANNYNMTTRINWPTGGRGAIRAIKSIDSNGYATLNDSSNDQITNRANFSVFGTTENKNGSYKLFTVPKGKSKIITVAIWLEAFDPAYSEDIIPPGATVEFDIEFCSSWDVVDTITFRDYTSDHWVDTVDEDQSNKSMKFGASNLDSPNNYYYSFTYNSTAKQWTAQIPRAVQNMKFIWQGANDTSHEDNTWTATTRGSNTTYTVFGSSAGLWYADDVTRITMNDYTSEHWLYGSDRKMRVQINYDGIPMDYSMTDSPTKDSVGKNTWGAYIPDSVDTVIFNRCDKSDTSTALNTWNGTNRGTETRYYALDSGKIEDIKGVAIYLTIPNDLQHFYDQNRIPAVSLTSQSNINRFKNEYNQDRTKFNQDTYYMSSVHGDKWPGTDGTMTLVNETDYNKTYAFYFDELEDGTYLTFWNKSQSNNFTNINNDTSFAPCFQYNASAGDEFMLYADPTQMSGNIVNGWVFTDIITRTYSGDGGNTTTPGKEQAGQWGPPNLPEESNAFQTNFYHTTTTATSVKATFEYYSETYTITMAHSTTDKRLWYALAGSIPNDVTTVTFTDNLGNTWTKSSSGSRTESTNYYYATSSTAGKWSAKITPPNGSYTTYFVPPSGNTASTVTASFVYNGVPFSVSLSKGSDGNWSTKGIPDSASSIVFTDNLGHTWTTASGRGSSANYYITSSNTAGKWGKLATEEKENMIYLKPNSNWTQASAWFAVYLWDGNGKETWVKMEASDTSGVYQCEIPDGFTTNVIFCRMNPASTTLDWGNKWNQTGDLKLPTDGKNLYTINSGQWDSGQNGSWSKK